MEHFIDDLLNNEDEERKLSAWEKHEEDCRKQKQLLTHRLHVHRKLSKPNCFHSWGNGLGKEIGGQVVLYAGAKRKEGQPNERTPKGSTSSYLNQDAIEAMLALANIAKKAIPYIWVENEVLANEKTQPFKGPRGTLWTPEVDRESFTYPSQRIRAGLEGNAGEVLKSEVAAFVDRYGLLHMPSSNGSFDSSSWLNPIQLSFMPKNAPADIGEFKRKRAKDLLACAEWEARVMFIDSEIDKLGLPRCPDITFDEYSEQRRIIEQKKKDIPTPDIFLEKAKKKVAELEKNEMSYRGPKQAKTIEQDFSNKLSGYAKEFSWMKNYKEMQKEFEDKRKAIDEEIRCLRFSGDGSSNQLAELEEKFFQLRFDFDDLVQACRRASRFLEEDKETIQQHGIWLVDIYAYYNAALLINDALDMLAASAGDEEALTRLLPLFHMAEFSPSEESLDVGGRYTLWYEAVGSDCDNPANELKGYEYDWVEDGCSIHLVLQMDRDGFCLYGGGWRQYVLCDSGETPSAFREVIKTHLPQILESLIQQGIQHNYKGRFAKAGSIDKKHPTISVNDLDVDLYATLWSVLDYIYKGDLELSYIQCEVCGGLKRIKREAGSRNSRRTCSDACRQRLSRGDINEDDTRIREKYRLFVSSGSEIRIDDKTRKSETVPETMNESDRSIIKAVKQAVAWRW